jgi:hypothetical protein
MPTLAQGKSHSWDRNNYSTLAVSWPDPTNPGTGKVSVRLGDDAATSYSVPRAGIAIQQKAGKLTNNTDKTISYTLT